MLICYISFDVLYEWYVYGCIPVSESCLCFLMFSYFLKIEMSNIICLCVEKIIQFVKSLFELPIE